MLGLGPRIDLDRAPVVLQQSRLHGAVWAGLGGLIVWTGLRMAPEGARSILCLVPTVVILLAGAFGAVDGLRRLAAPQTLVIEPSGLTIRDWRSERRLAWTDIGSFSASKAGVAFVTRRGMDDERTPTIRGGYWMFPSALADGLTAARHRWAQGVPEPRWEPGEASTVRQILVVAAIFAVLVLAIVSRFTHPFASCSPFGGGRQTASVTSLCPADLLATSKGLMAWT